MGMPPQWCTVAPPMSAAMAFWEGMRAEGEGTSGAYAMKKLMQEAVVIGRKAQHGDDAKTVLDGGSSTV